MITVAFEGDTMIQFVNESLLFKEVCMNISQIANLRRDIMVIISTEEGTASGNTTLPLHVYDHCTHCKYLKTLFCRFN